MSETKEAAIVTGAGSGIGYATTEILLREGYAVHAVDRTDEGLAELARGHADAPLTTATVNVRGDTAPEEIVDGCIAAHGRLDVLVNNAGVGHSNRLESSDDANIDRILDVNIRAVMRVSRAALAHLPRPGGRIVNIASIFGFVGFPGTAAYSVSKAAVAELTRQMCADYAPEGLRVNAIAPGIILTGMTRERLANNAAFRDAMVGATPLGRAAEPAEVGEAIAFLCSPRASFIHGVVLPVDGGWLAARVTAAGE
jgi:NAD(P)-dependent dehydrogenase (short-subunit alcohol dehydrogenase family)